MRRATPPDERIPPAAPGMTIGLYGGSFNPPHRAHRKVAMLALKRLKLDQVWWMVTPGNPLKTLGSLPPLAERAAAARRIARHPRIRITGLEAQLGTRYTYDTLKALKARRPDLHFIWIMGADNLVQFHRWGHWREIAQMVPLAIIDRPGASFRALSSRAALALMRYRLPEHDAAQLKRCPPPAWVFLHGLKSRLSSSAIRAGQTVKEPV